MAADPQWLAAINQAIGKLVHTKLHFWTDHIWEMVGRLPVSTHEKRALAGPIGDARRAGLIVADGFVHTAVPSRHRGYVRRWRSTVVATKAHDDGLECLLADIASQESVGGKYISMAIEDVKALVAEVKLLRKRALNDEEIRLAALVCNRIPTGYIGDDYVYRLNDLVVKLRAMVKM